MLIDVKGCKYLNYCWPGKGVNKQSARGASLLNVICPDLPVFIIC